MERNYWQEYWENYYKFMAVYLSELQNAYPNVDIREGYLEVADLFEPSMPNEDYNDNYDNDNDYDYEEAQLPPFTFPGGITIPGGGQFPNQPGGGQSPNQPGGGQSPNQPGGGQSPTPFISPGGGQFTINNCRRMAIVRIVMRRGFNPSEFFLVVDRADRRSIQGFRIACEGGRVRFVPMAVEYRNINFIECAF